MPIRADVLALTGFVTRIDARLDLIIDILGDGDGEEADRADT